MLHNEQKHLPFEFLISATEWRFQFFHVFEVLKSTHIGLWNSVNLKTFFYLSEDYAKARDSCSKAAEEVELHLKIIASIMYCYSASITLRFEEDDGNPYWKTMGRFTYPKRRVGTPTTQIRTSE